MNIQHQIPSDIVSRLYARCPLRAYRRNRERQRWTIRKSWNKKKKEKEGEKKRKYRRRKTTRIYHLARARGNEVHRRGTWHVTVSSPRDFHNRDIFLRPPRFFSSTTQTDVWLVIGVTVHTRREFSFPRGGRPVAATSRGKKNSGSLAPENCTPCVTEFCRARSLIDFSDGFVPPAGHEPFRPPARLLVFSFRSFPARTRPSSFNGMRDKFFFFLFFLGGASRIFRVEISVIWSIAMWIRSFGIFRRSFCSIQWTRASVCIVLLIFDV